MYRTLRRRSRTDSAVPLILALALLAGVPPSPILAQAPAEAAALASLPPELVRVRANLDKYRDPIVAVHDGYLSSVACVAYAKGSEGTMHYAAGGMGVHFLNFQLVGKPLDPAKPQVLIYEPDGDRLRLAAAEWFVPVGVAGSTRPTILGQELQGPMEGHDPLQPKGLHHYDLHVWLWQHNPAGTFAPTNPDVTCPEGSYSFREHAPKLVDPSAH
ncbi:MAG TPA: hypothetical protein VHL81_04915 [Gemmatimonadales bacterium]|jgi:hypothetical protein|nr:hypothetical protein [Gemmatimonadales bacterium]